MSTALEDICGPPKQHLGIGGWVSSAPQLTHCPAAQPKPADHTRNHFEGPLKARLAQVFSSPAQRLPTSAPTLGWRCRSSPLRTLARCSILPSQTPAGPPISPTTYHTPQNKKPAPTPSLPFLQTQPAKVDFSFPSPASTWLSVPIGHLACPCVWDHGAPVWGPRSAESMESLQMSSCFAASPQGKLKLFGKTCCAAGEGCTGWNGMGWGCSPTVPPNP